MSMFNRKPMGYFQVEFWCGAPGFPSIVHVVANESEEAAILAKATRIAGGLKGRDAAIEHVWQVHDKEKLERTMKFRMETAPRILSEKEMNIERLKNAADLIKERDAIIEKLTVPTELTEAIKEMVDRVIFINKAIGVDSTVKMQVVELTPLESEDE
jgi:hypothetical protein